MMKNRTVDPSMWRAVHAEPREGVDDTQFLRMAQMWLPQMPKAAGGDRSAENSILKR